MRLGEVTNFSVVSPNELNPADFKIPEAPEHFEHELEVLGGRASMTAFHTIRNLLAEHHIREEHKTDWTKDFVHATKNFDGKKIRVRIVFDKNTGLSFEVTE